MNETLLLVLAGVAAGLAGTIAGLASLVSYPALLALGLPPVVANITNTTAMTTVIPGAVLGSRRELKGKGVRVLQLCALAGLGGVTGAALLLRTPASTFSALAPLLIGFGSLLLLFRDRIRALAIRNRPADRSAGGSCGGKPQIGPRAGRPTAALALAVFCTGIYGGYFGAAAGIIMLAVLSVGYVDPLAVTNAIKTIVTGASNVIAALTFALTAPVDWHAVAGLGTGLLIGAWLGPQIGRDIPDRPLRVVVAGAGIGLAIWLAVA